ncbi:Alpha/Beta hydrolase protein [Aspergillus aurantiobrunneus]
MRIDTDRIIESAVCNLESVLNGVMVLGGYLTSFILYFTINRILLAAVLIPLYLYKVLFSIFPSVIKNSPEIVKPGGWSRLARNTERYRSRRDTFAHSQLEGTYRFKADEVFHIDRNSRGWMASVPWANNTHEFHVCGARVRYVHLQATHRTILQDGRSSHRPIVFLHGNPSWSYMWRDVFASLLDRGHDIYALDWLGHGRSDKVLRREAITFELHIRTLMEFFQATELQDAIIAAHDWGGCIALCTIPRLPIDTCDSLFLLNSFFPPRRSDESLHYRLLSRIWYCLTGLLHGYIPESAVVRFLAPHLSQEDIATYAAPYRDLPRSSKSSIERFSHSVPSLPRFVLFNLRQTYTWKVLEGLAGPEHFDSLSTQARLSAQGDQVRGFWGDRQDDNELDVLVVCGDKDPIVRDYKSVLVRSMHPEHMVHWASRGLWIMGAGHLPMEERPGEVAGLIGKFAGGQRMQAT